MKLETVAILYIILSFTLLNTAWVPALTMTRLFKVTSFWGYFLEWSLRLAGVFYVGYLLDMHYSNAPHQFYNNWQLYSTFIASSAAFSIPGFVYFYATRKKRNTKH